MSIEKAKAFFLGKEGFKKLTCGQAVLAAFKERFAVSESEMNEFSAYAVGRAPGGDCGAFYAVNRIFTRHGRKDKVETCRKEFLSIAGSTKCKDIRSSKKLSCLGCVEKAAKSLTIEWK
jgi:hypothetical protein